MNHFQRADPPPPRLHAPSSFGCGHRPFSGSASSRWQLAFLSSRNYPPPSPGTVGMAALEGGQPVSTCASRVEPDRPLPAGRVWGRRSGGGADWRGSRAPRGEKLSQQGWRSQQLWAASGRITLHGEARPAFRRPLLVGGFAVIDAFVLFCDSFDKQRAASGS